MSVGIWGVQSFQIQKKVEFRIKELIVLMSESHMELLKSSNMPRDVSGTAVEESNNNSNNPSVL